MPTLASPVATPATMPIVNAAHVGKMAGTVMHFPTRSAFDTAIAAAGTTALWADGQKMTISGEPPLAVRVWNLTHARTVQLGTKQFVLGSNSNAILTTTSGAPSSGTGANGDAAVEMATGIIYAKVSGAWIPFIGLSDAGDASSYAAGGLGSSSSPLISSSGSGTLQEAASSSLAGSARGYTVHLSDDEYSVTSPYTFTGGRTTILGTGAAWANDPNAEAKPDTGSVLSIGGTAMAALILGGGSGVTLHGFTVWGRGRFYNATYNTAGTGYNAGIRIPARHDKLVMDRLFVGRAHVGLEIESSAQMDVATISNCGFIGNWYGIRMRDTSISIMSNWKDLTVADNDGPGFVGANAMFRNKFSGCNFVRNCRGMTGGGAQVTIYGPGTIVTANDFSEAGKMQSAAAGMDETGVGTDDTGGALSFDHQQANIDDLRIHGDAVQVYGNQFMDHYSTGGACVHVMSDATNTYIGPNLWSNNQHAQIIIDAGATDTTIVMSPGLLTSKITDNGTNTKYVIDREALTADRTYYVRTDGNNSNEGRTNTSGGAFHTVQAALDAIAKLDFAGHKIAIDVQTGTYTGQIVIPVMTGQLAAADLDITSSSGGVTLTWTTAFDDIISINAGARARIGGVTIAGSGSNNQLGLHAFAGSTVEVVGTTFGANLFVHIAAEGGNVVMAGGYTITGGAFAHLLIEFGGFFRAYTAGAITLTGTPAFDRFVQCATNGVARFDGTTFTGSATGKRYNAELNAVVYTNGGGASYLPGDASGVTATGGQYN